MQLYNLKTFSKLISGIFILFLGLLFFIFVLITIKTIQISSLNFEKSELIKDYKIESLGEIYLSFNKFSKINELSFSKTLHTKNLPDPDLLIRTGGFQRLSNFMLWQLAYTEIFFEKKLWPDFKSDDFKEILNKFKLIKRNFGTI